MLQVSILLDPCYDLMEVECRLLVSSAACIFSVLGTLTDCWFILYFLVRIEDSRGQPQLTTAWCTLESGVWCRASVGNIDGWVDNRLMDYTIIARNTQSGHSAQQHTLADKQG